MGFNSGFKGLMRAALFIMRATNSSVVFTFSLQTSLFNHPHRQKSDLYAPTSNSCIFTPIQNWTQVHMNLFTRNSPYYHLLKYLVFLLKHPIYLPFTNIRYAVCVFIIFQLLDDGYSGQSKHVKSVKTTFVQQLGNKQLYISVTSSPFDRNRRVVNFTFLLLVYPTFAFYIRDDCHTVDRNMQQSIMCII